jgi:hypothetical protein
MTGISKRRFYSQLHHLINFGLVKRRNRRYALTSFGVAVYNGGLIIEAAVREYYNLKAVDSVIESEYIRKHEVRELIHNVITDGDLKMILLEKNPSDR